ncbi:MAG: HD domain-containing protein, partial [Verrucomicrobia bacterium]|nr:HD domain-containing protein [Verrucomicrobiota bacterium]
LDLLAKVRESYPHVIRLMLSGKLGVKELLDAVQSGVIHRYLTKPWLREELLVVLRNSVARKVSESEITVSAGEGSAVDSVGEEATGASQIIYSAEQAEALVDAYLRIIRTFHPNLGSVATRTMALCRTIAEVLQLPAEQGRSLVWAGGLHDIGLISLDRPLVRKWLKAVGSCNDEELALIKRHSEESEAILRETPIFEEASVIVRHHHENWDGAGYPSHLRGEAIPWLARLLSAAIYFCNRTSGSIEARKDMDAQKERMFDPKAVEVIAQAVPLTELPPGIREISLKDLQAGMVMARDVLSGGGVLVVAKDKELTNAWVNKVIAISSAAPLNQNLFVYF